MTAYRAWRAASCLVVAGAVLVTGCSSRPSTSAAGTTAQDFYRAVAAGDGAGACALLAPATVESLEEDADAGCDEAILEGDVGETLNARAQDGTAVVRVAGRNAQVTLPADVLFLTV